uniref:DUF4219 domain-containing protein n=1 Tax=Oryza brachyantha TaxID=4533 RepID=J3L3U5_ORYBR
MTKIGDSSKSGERVVANSGVVELTSANCHVWALVIQVLLEALELWDVVEAASKYCTKDRHVLDAILRGVPFEIKATLAVKKTKEAWDAIKSMRVGDDCVKATSVQRLWKDFEGIIFTMASRSVVLEWSLTLDDQSCDHGNDAAKLKPR